MSIKRISENPRSIVKGRAAKQMFMGKTVKKCFVYKAFLETPANGKFKKS